MLVSPSGSYSPHPNVLKQSNCSDHLNVVSSKFTVALHLFTWPNFDHRTVCLQQVSTNIPKIQVLSPNSRVQKGDMNPFPYWGPTVLAWPVNLIFASCLLLGACELIHVFVQWVEKTVIIMLKLLGTTIQNLVTQDLCIPDLQIKRKQNLLLLLSLLLLIFTLARSVECLRTVQFTAMSV